MKIALLGSGEFLDWTSQIDHELVSGSINPSGSVLVVPTASAPEGDGVFNRWGKLGLDHFQALNISAKVLPLKTKADANNPKLVKKLETASLVYFSGGNPAYVVSVLKNSMFWKALTKAINDGLSFAGCSAGATMLGAKTIDSKVEKLSPKLFTAGLGYFPNLFIAPHFDQFENYLPGFTDYLLKTTKGTGVMGIDEDTAALSESELFKVYGSGSVHLTRSNKTLAFRAGQFFRL